MRTVQLQGSPVATGAEGNESARVRSISKHEASKTSPKGGVKWGQDSWAPSAPPGKGGRGNGSSSSPSRERSSELHSYLSRPHASAEEEIGSVGSGASSARTSAGTSQAGSEFSDSRLMSRYLESKRSFKGVRSSSMLSGSSSSSLLSLWRPLTREQTRKTGQVDAKAQYAQAVQKIDRFRIPKPACLSPRSIHDCPSHIPCTAHSTQTMHLADLQRKHE